MHRTRTPSAPAWTMVAFLSAALLALAGCGTPEPDRSPGSASGSPAPSTGAPTSGTPEPTSSGSSPGQVALREQAVAAGHPAAVRVGTEILEQGGNAADAAIASAFAVSVVEPFASGIGGGGSALVAQGDSPPEAYDYRETVALDGRIPASGAGIPGFVDGMATLHEEHGSLEWSELLAPAIRLAGEGFAVSEMLHQRLRADYGPGAIEGLEHFHGGIGGWAPLSEGDTLVQSELAATLQTLAEDGPESLYTGSLAEELTAVDGIDAASLAGYETVASEPVSGSFGDHTFVSAAPPLPGAAVVQLLQVADALEVADAAPGSAEYVDTLSAAWQVAEASVTRSFGDPAFVEVPVDELTEAESNADLARSEVGPVLAATAAGGPVEPAAAAKDPIEAGNTTHLTVVDDEGLTVSMTNTITSFWGGADATNVGGFFLNNQLSRFESLDTAANQPEPGRKSVSWSAPSLVLDAEGRVVLGLGSPGGQAIPSILATVMVPWALQDATLQEAVDAPRHYLQDGVLALEGQPSAEVAELVRQRGWQTQVTERADAVFGSVQALEIDYGTGTITGAADSRREGDVAVVPAG